MNPSHHINRSKYTMASNRIDPSNHTLTFKSYKKYIKASNRIDPSNHMLTFRSFRSHQSFKSRRSVKITPILQIITILQSNSYVTSRLTFKVCVTGGGGVYAIMSHLIYTCFVTVLLQCTLSFSLSFSCLLRLFRHHRHTSQWLSIYSLLRLSCPLGIFYLWQKVQRLVLPLRTSGGPTVRIATINICMNLYGYSLVSGMDV